MACNLFFNLQIFAHALMVEVKSNDMHMYNLRQLILITLLVHRPFDRKERCVQLWCCSFGVAVWAACSGQEPSAWSAQSGGVG